MSTESAKAFIERMKTDEDFAKKVGECKDAEARMSFVREAGYTFSPDEVGSLSDDDLQAIIGGTTSHCTGYTRFGR